MKVYVQYDDICESVVCVHSEPDTTCEICIKYKKAYEARYGKQNKQLEESKHEVW